MKLSEQIGAPSRIGELHDVMVSKAPERGDVVSEKDIPKTKTLDLSSLDKPSEKPGEEKVADMTRWDKPIELVVVDPEVDADLVCPKLPDIPPHFTLIDEVDIFKPVSPLSKWVVIAKLVQATGMSGNDMFKITFKAKSGIDKDRAKLQISQVLYAREITNQRRLSSIAYLMSRWYETVLIGA